MSTKQEKAANRAFLRGKKQGKVSEEKHILALLIAIILVLLYLLVAQHNGWWPYQRAKLGSAFYTNVSASTTAPSATSSSSGASGSSSGGSTTSTGGSGSSGSGSGGTSTTTPPPASSSNPIASFAAGVNVGESMTEVNSQANGLSPNCAVVASAETSNVGRQEVCTYTQGDKIITVTYLNNRVISASKSGF
ncbi:MAG TPA: hypothetical protein VJP80_04990 [Candidatus Saccharimonadales bacterium]|nr:hypothetical protein [Candidatus Saccharimonadales bacterium]